MLAIGCGTGLSLALLSAAVGPAGSVVGVDASAGMLGRARARISRRRWANVRLVHADAGARDLSRLAGGAADAVLFAYSLWALVARDTIDAEQRVLRGGHIRIAAGTVPT